MAFIHFISIEIRGRKRNLNININGQQIQISRVRIIAVPLYTNHILCLISNKQNHYNKTFVVQYCMQNVKTVTVRIRVHFEFF